MGERKRDFIIPQEKLKKKRKRGQRNVVQKMEPFCFALSSLFSNLDHVYKKVLLKFKNRLNTFK